MIALIALALITSEPAPLLGGPEAVKPDDVQAALVYEAQSYRAEGAYQRTRQERTTTGWSTVDVSAQATRPLQAGDPIALDDGFFQGPLTGGVGGEPPRLIVVRQRGHRYYRWR